jgi:glycosyltransferase involved in cell wall biosynthesis
MKTVIAFLDKEWRPNHSFVDGMLSNTLAREKDINVKLIVSDNKQEKKAYKYNQSICLPLLFQRKGIFRFLNFFKVIYIVIFLVRKERKKGNNIVFFVRNDPIYLFAVSLMKRKYKLIFQSSFPHEEVSGSFIKRIIAKSMYKLSSFNVDSLLAVSPKGLERIKKLFPKIKTGYYIPLLSNNSLISKDKKFDLNKDLRFVYIGSHAKERKLEIIFKSIYNASKKIDIKFEFEFIGGSDFDLEILREKSYINELEDKKIIKFVSFIPRNKLIEKLETFDIGICLIPPDPHYLEASPTKLTEYMGEGLAILTNYGIELQEIFINESKGGVIVNWDIDEISNSIIHMCKNRKKINIMKIKSYNYSRENLTYKNYIKYLKKCF